MLNCFSILILTAVWHGNRSLFDIFHIVMVTSWAFQHDTPLFQLILKVENRLVQRIATSPSWKWSCCEAHFNSLKSPRYISLVTLLNCFVVFLSSFLYEFCPDFAWSIWGPYQLPWMWHSWTVIFSLATFCALDLHSERCHHSVWRGVILIVLDWQIPPRILRQVILWHWLEKPAIDWLAAFWRKSIVLCIDLDHTKGTAVERNALKTQLVAWSCFVSKVSIMFTEMGWQDWTWHTRPKAAYGRRSSVPSAESARLQAV